MDMSAGVEANAARVEVGAAPPSSECPRQPAFAEYVDYPETVQLEETIEEESAADRFARRIQWPALVLLALLEAGWLIALGRVLDRFV